MKQTIFSFYILLFFGVTVQAQTYDLRKYGLKANTRENSSLLLSAAIKKIVAEHQSDTPIVLRFPKGTYHFYPTTELEREYYISNHDQNNPKSVGIVLEKLKNIEVDGNGSDFIFHGRMLPLSIAYCENCTFKNFSVDFENPHITQMKVVKNDPELPKSLLK